jgi:hypothetical protein
VLRQGWEKPRGLIFALAAIASLCVAAPASGATLVYASPTGNDGAGTNPCTDSTQPCTIERAVEGLPPIVAGYDVTVYPGTYNLTGVLTMPNTGPNPQTALHGAPGATRPTINVTGTDGSGAGVYVRGTLSDVNVNVPVGVGAPSRAVKLEDANDSVERVYAHNANPSRRACDLSGTVRDTICWESGNGGVAVELSLGPTFSDTATLRNVTAIASGTASVGTQAFAGGVNSSAVLTATNVISRGTMTDVVVSADQASSTATVTLDHSNYLTTNATGGGTISITAPGSGTNLTTAPAFVDAANGDFRQDPAQDVGTSGTVDKGTAAQVNGVDLGASDLDGQIRNLGALPDIGADELGHFTTASLVCAPGSLTVGSSTTCTVTVNDPLGPPAPSGVPGLSSSLGGVLGGPCFLTPATTESTCQATFTPSAAGAHLIAAAYGGDPQHDGSQATTTLNVAGTPAPPAGSMTPPPATTPPAATKKKCKKKRHKAAATAAKKCKKRR